MASGGWRRTVATDIPTGARLSSSAAIEVAVIRSVLARCRIEWSPIEIARSGQHVENEVVGLPSGIMDQFISAGAVAARQPDGLPVTHPRAEPLPPGTTVAVMDTGTRRVLAEAAYADRRQACERAAKAIGVDALHDRGRPIWTGRRSRRPSRAHHVVTENRERSPPVRRWNAVTVAAWVV